MEKKWIEFTGKTDSLSENEHYWVRTSEGTEHRVLFHNGKFELDSHLIKKKNIEIKLGKSRCLLDDYESDTVIPSGEIKYIVLDDE